MLLNGMKYSEIDVIILKVCFVVCMPVNLISVDVFDRLMLKTITFQIRTLISDHDSIKPRSRVVVTWLKVMIQMILTMMT